MSALNALTPVLITKSLKRLVQQRRAVGLFIYLAQQLQYVFALDVINMTALGFQHHIERG